MEWQNVVGTEKKIFFTSNKKVNQEYLNNAIHFIKFHTYLLEWYTVYIVYNNLL